MVRACLLMLLALGLAGCWEATLDLPGGWKQASWSGYGYMLLKTAENSTRVKLAIGPTVERCRVIGAVITGQVVAEPPEIDPRMKPTSGSPMSLRSRACRCSTGSAPRGDAISSPLPPVTLPTI